MKHIFPFIIIAPVAANYSSRTLDFIKSNVTTARTELLQIFMELGWLSNFHPLELDRNTKFGINSPIAD